MLREVDAYKRVLNAREETRPKALDFIENIIREPVYFAGDRGYGEDQSIIAGIGYLGERPVSFLASHKGKNLEENLKHNFAMPKPEGYRKALRIMKQAEKFNRPVITFVDTPGAYPGIGAEKRGQAWAISENIMEMAYLESPIISVITGEGGSGGALALSVANKIIMMENSIYSILSPEGFASILYKDRSKAREVCKYMKLTSQDLYEHGLADYLIKEDRDFSQIYKEIENLIRELLDSYQGKDKDFIVRDRLEKFSKFGGGEIDSKNT